MQNSLKILGLTGGIASGKSTVSLFLKKQKGYVFDCDKIAHNVILKGSPAYNEVIAAIKGDYLDECGQINRKKLGAIVFNNPDKLKLLESVIHKEVSRVIKKKIPTVSAHKYRFIVIDAPLLLEGGLADMCHNIMVICAPFEERVSRLTLRDGLTKEEASLRISIQRNWDKPLGLGYIIINNDKGIKELNIMVKKKLKEILD